MKADSTVKKGLHADEQAILLRLRFNSVRG
jgi:hypothetical protein